MKILAALVVALAAMWGWSVAQAEEARVEGFAFVCETVEGDKVKPKLGDIEGVSYSDLPAEREQCLEDIGRKMAQCRANVDFGSDTKNWELCRVSAAIPRAGAVVRRALRARAGQVRRSGRGVDRGGQPRCKRAAAPSKGRWRPQGSTRGRRTASSVRGPGKQFRLGRRQTGTPRPDT